MNIFVWGGLGGLFLYGVVAVGRFAGSNESCVIDHGDVDTVWIPVLPPVPPSLRVVTDADWLADQPVACLSDEQVRLRCQQLEDSL